MWFWTVEWKGAGFLVWGRIRLAKGNSKSTQLLPDFSFLLQAILDLHWDLRIERRGHSGTCQDKGQGGALDAPRGWGLQSGAPLMSPRAGSSHGKPRLYLSQVLKPACIRQGTLTPAGS